MSPVTARDSEFDAFLGRSADGVVDGTAEGSVAGAVDGVIDGIARFDPADLPALLKRVPAKWAVYGMFDADDRPVQLLCVKNLRQSLKRRLGEEEPSGPSRRVDYRALVQTIRWRRVDSRFEADQVYLGLARALFPATYGELVPSRPAWFLHVDPEASFPRYVRTTELTLGRGQYIGPLEDRSSAAKLIEQIESAFDLCRYHQILMEAPTGRACAYKEMKRCPAPCDGSIAMHQYRRMVEMSLRVLLEPGDAVREHEGRMRQAAAELKFELAGRIKQFIGELSVFGKGPYRHTRRLEDFQFVVLQRGPREGTAKVFLVTPGRVTEEAGLVAEPTNASSLLRLALERVEWRRSAPIGMAGAETLAIVAHHLYAIKNTAGVFLPVSEVDDTSLVRGYRELSKQKATEPADENDEGVLQESAAV